MDVYFDMIVENDDEESAAGKQTVLLIDCNLDSVILAKLDGDSDDALDEDADFTFAVYGNTIDNTEVMFCYGWLDGDDSDNVLPATSFEEDADTVHIHDLAVFVTNQEAASVSVQVAPGSYVTREQMTTYAAPLVHTQGADTITETTGENTEQVQRRQDSDIEAIKEQLNTGFTGTTVTHTFAPAQLSYWKGYDGTGVPEGILDQTRNRLYL